MAFYTQDKSQRITLRLNQAQFDFVKENADILGVSPSEFLRMVVNSTMITQKSVTDKIKLKLENSIAEGIAESEGVGRANDKTNLNDIV